MDVVVVIAVVLWLLRAAFGLLGSLSAIRTLRSTQP
jgi:hypothetical protein